MLRRSSWTCLPLLLTSAFLSGCGDDQQQAAPLTKNQVKGAAQALASDPDASPTARRIAQAALDRGQQNDMLDQFQKGQ